MRPWIYGLLFSYISITTGASFGQRWFGQQRSFLATLGDMLPTMVLFLRGEGIAYLYLGLKWLIALLVIHRIFFLLVVRKFETPFGFGIGWSFVAAIGLGLLISAVGVHVTAGLMMSEGLAAASMFPYMVAAVWLPITFIVVELISLHAYVRTKNKT